MQFGLRVLFLPLTLVAIGLGWHYKSRVNFLFDPPTPILAMLIPALGAAIGAGVAALTSRKHMAWFAIAFAAIAAVAFLILTAGLRAPR